MDQLFSVNCGFFDAVNSDRVYAADDMNKPYSRVIADGVFASNQGTPSNDLQTISAGVGLNIVVLAGQGIFAGKWFENGSSIPIAVPQNTDLYTRIDSVIVQVDLRVSGRTGSIVYRTGEASATPQHPAINTIPNVREWRLADVSVAAGAVSLSDAVITDLRGSAECPWVTSLIQQVDTSTLWNQFNAAYAAQFARFTQDYESYVAAQRQAWDDFIRTLTDDLTVTTNVITRRQKVVLTAPMTTQISIMSQAFDPASDILEVFINGLLADPAMYTLAQDGSKITLAAGLPAGNSVEFVIFKALVSGDLDSVASMITALNDKVDAFMQDSGRVQLTLNSGVSAYNADFTPCVRRVGNRVYLSGAIKKATSALEALFTLPVGFRPPVHHEFITAAVNSRSGDLIPLSILIYPTGVAKLSSRASSFGNTRRISIATDFLTD